MKSNSIDFTKSFRNLSKIYLNEMEIKKSVFSETKSFSNWYKKWEHELNAKKVQTIGENINNINPCYIPRNHIIEEALMHAMNDNNLEIQKLMKILENPF